MPTSAASRILPVMDLLTIDDLTKRLCLEAKIVVNLSFFGDKAWMRLSANVYNSQEDYVKLKDRLTQFFQNPKNATAVWVLDGVLRIYFLLRHYLNNDAFLPPIYKIFFTRLLSVESTNPILKLANRLGRVKDGQPKLETDLWIPLE